MLLLKASCHLASSQPQHTLQNVINLLIAIRCRPTQAQTKLIELMMQKPK